MSNDYDFKETLDKLKATEVPGLSITSWQAWAVMAGVLIAGFFLGKIL